MKDIKNYFIAILIIICLVLVGITFESHREVINIELVYKQELFELRSQLDAARFDLQGASSHIEMLNKEREQK